MNVRNHSCGTNNPPYQLAVITPHTCRSQVSSWADVSFWQKGTFSKWLVWVDTCFSDGLTCRGDPGCHGGCRSLALGVCPQPNAPKSDLTSICGALRFLSAICVSAGFSIDEQRLTAESSYKSRSVEASENLLRNGCVKSPTRDLTPLSRRQTWSRTRDHVTRGLSNMLYSLWYYLNKYKFLNF